MILVRRLFLRLVASIYLVSFLSLGVQVEGLVGSRGILPVADYLEWVELQVPGVRRFFLLPTLFWLDRSDGALVIACAAGALLAVVLFLEWAPVPVLAALWALSLSLACAGQVFLGYQWDYLLLEVGLLAVFLAPLSLRVRSVGQSPPSPIAVWLLRWLLFRLMFGSGWVKLASGDPTWRNLTALRVHYETQPLPTWVGFWVHQLPGWFHTASAALMFGVELVVPFLIFGPRRLRLVACTAFMALQALIALTGNYGFFNLLAAALAVLLLDDEALLHVLRRQPGPPELSVAGRWPRPVLAAAAGVIGLVSAVEVTSMLGLPSPWPRPVTALHDAAAPFRSVNSYGLFAVMTTSRPEIVVEGSHDGVTWTPYEFRWKPGDVAGRPRFVAPHQPRLDWQMWFAALGSCERNDWFVSFLARLREGSPPAVKLLARDPFPGRPPAHLRAMLYDYRFADLEARRGSGVWWVRTSKGPYCSDLVFD